ncbi:PHP domain-containing protein [Georgenia thermotolerans]|uniref:PHP domain-containing protein n=1 Tax=Georgenia thermotolerans TaxID=527326 RepID=A0A7J5UJL8_9MICO|nr:PHP domain-containing protein [Georgenia thermotolerans]KAE8762354.1 PHP domain-containing protein [Georgenia thermotolerans]
MRIDPHTHSAASDGTDSPAGLVRAAAAAGLDVVGLTDHDTVRGWAEAEEAALEAGVALLRGAELSCQWRGITVHLLSYLHDPADATLAGEMEAARRSRLDRARTMVDRISRDYPITWASVQAQVGAGATVGRPHIADALVAAGVMPDRSTAFDTVLSVRGPYYIPYHAPDAVEAVAMVRAAGGVPVMAHPRASVRGRVVPDTVIAEMAEAGLAGLEIDHRDHTAGAVEELGALAGRLGLARTGSSDYHGTGKPNRLGEHTTAPAVLELIESEGFLPVVRP